MKSGAENGVGVVRNDKDIGFFIHPSIVIDHHQGHILGVSSLQIWTREEGRRDKQDRQYSQLPIEEKESNRWIIGCQQSAQELQEAAHLTFAQDREGDIFEQFAAISNDQYDLVIRNRGDRCLTDGGNLYNELATAPLAGSYQLQVNGDKRLSRTSRLATISVRYTRAASRSRQNPKAENFQTALFFMPLKPAKVMARESVFYGVY